MDIERLSEIKLGSVFPQEPFGNENLQFLKNNNKTLQKKKLPEILLQKKFSAYIFRKGAILFSILDLIKEHS